ncbi:MAG: hypothetical protein HC905_20395 [Bacteroidales bacterium]|nr:hypothetical protein [Bacteroidales bacterium]
MIKKVLLIVLAYYALLILHSCCNCGPYPIYIINWSDISLKNIDVEYDGESINLNPTNDTLIGDYGVLINFSYKLGSMRPKFDLMSQAFSCSCKDGEYILKNKVNRIELVTLNDYDSVHLANSNITEYFFSYLATDNNVLPEEILSVNEAIDNGPFSTDIDGYSVLALLGKNHKPTLDKHILLKILVTLDDSTTLADTTKLVRLI